MQTGNHNKCKINEYNYYHRASRTADNQQELNSCYRLFFVGGLPCCRYFQNIKIEKEVHGINFQRFGKELLHYAEKFNYPKQYEHEQDTTGLSAKGLQSSLKLESKRVVAY